MSKVLLIEMVNVLCVCRVFMYNFNYTRLCSVFCVLCSVFCVLCSVFCVLVCVVCSVCCVLCVVCCVLCVVCSVFCVLCSVKLIHLNSIYNLHLIDLIN